MLLTPGGRTLPHGPNDPQLFEGMEIVKHNANEP